MSLLTSEEINKYLSIVDKVPEAERKKINALLELDRVERCKDSFLFFVQQMWPVFISGRHHQIMADAFERVANGKLKRLIINMPPRHTKSEFASFLLPAWFLGKFPQKKIIQTAHTAELATGFGRKVRNLVQSDPYQKVFDTQLSSDSKAAGRWNTSKGGDYFAIGVGGAVTGKGADILIIDDPHSEQEAKQNNPAVYDGVYEWYTSGPRQRLQPGGSIIIVMCMTGDTDVLMADASLKKLKDISVGDCVATYEDGQLSTSYVNNFQSSGVDSIFTIKTQSGRIIRANKKHPFLVDWHGERKWARLEDLSQGMLLVATKDALDRQDRNQNPECVPLAKQKQATIEKTQTLHTSQLEIMGNGLAKRVRAEIKFLQRDSVSHVIESNTHRQNQHLNSAEQGGSSTVTGSLKSSILGWWKSAITAAMFVVNILPRKTHAHTGMESSASITVTKQDESEGCCAMTVTSQSGTEKRLISYEEPLNTYSVTVDEIVSITSSGEEEVFDVEIDRTENFIANGVVSHNTRWAKRDLTGQIIKKSGGDGVDQWEVIEFPAIMPSGNPLWPAFWKKEELEAIKAEIPVAKWEAQYQQNPTSEDGAIIKRDQWKVWESKNPPACDYIIQSWDTAFEKNNRADFSACTTWGIFEHPDDHGVYKTNIILLDAFKERMEFPELKKQALELYNQWQPDTLIVEKRAAGAPLIYELRKIGIPLSEYTPGKGNDKIARVNAIADLFASGIVWCPSTRWAEEVMDELASFPNGDHDDLVDSSSQALMRFRQGGFISIATDEPDEPVIQRRHAYY